MNSDSNTNSSSEDLHTSSDSDDTTESNSSRSPSPVIDFGEISQRFLNQSMNPTVQVQAQRAHPSLPKPVFLYRFSLLNPHISPFLNSKNIVKSVILTFPTISFKKNSSIFSRLFIAKNAKSRHI